jgi:cytochrome c553
MLNKNLFIVVMFFNGDLTDQEMADVAAYYASLPAN